jgi:propionyl-CoA carboxylase alpha chain
VELMLRVAAGETLPLTQAEVPLRGWAIESRLYAEDPYRNFLPSTGRLTRYRPPEERADADHAVRNDTGVYEGGEISTFYDPMIAKLCTWAPTRAAAIEGMAVALDEFEVEGVGNNLPFLSAVMGQERFRAGRLTTGYIAEEFPDGFNGVALSDALIFDIVAVAAMLQLVVADRRGGVSRTALGSGHTEVFADWVAVIGGEQVPVQLRRIDPEGQWELTLLGSAPLVDRFVWQPGETLARIDWHTGRSTLFKVSPITGGFRIRYRGADCRVLVLQPHVAELMAYMPVKTPPDLSRFLLAPMPGQLVRLDVAVGDIVEDGQALAIVEAMKMENVLKAEKRARVSKVLVAPGAVLAVDQVIMEFEGV